MRSALLVLPILSGVLWGAAGIFVRILSDYGMDGATIVFIRVAIAAVMMLALILVMDRTLLRFRARDVWLFVVCALCMVGLNLFYTVAADTLSLSLAAVLLSMSPVFMVLIARVAFGEAITSLKVVCIAVSIVGCVLVSGLVESGTELSAVGVACGIGAALFYALYGIVSKRAASQGYSVYTVLFYCMLLSTVFLSPFADYGVLGSYCSEGIWNIGFLVLQTVVTSFLPYIFYTTAMARMEAGSGSILAACGEPVAAAMFGLLVFAEVPSPLMVLGMVLAIGSMALMCMPPRGEKKASGEAERRRMPPGIRTGASGLTGFPAEDSLLEGRPSGVHYADDPRDRPDCADQHRLGGGELDVVAHAREDEHGKADHRQDDQDYALHRPSEVHLSGARHEHREQDRELCLHRRSPPATQSELLSKHLIASSCCQRQRRIDSVVSDLNLFEYKKNRAM